MLFLMSHPVCALVRLTVSNIAEEDVLYLVYNFITANRAVSGFSRDTRQLVFLAFRGVIRREIFDNFVRTKVTMKMKTNFVYRVNREHTS